MTNDQNNAKAYMLAMHGAPWAIHPGRMQGFLDTLIVSDMTPEEMDARTGPRDAKFFLPRQPGDAAVNLLAAEGDPFAVAEWNESMDERVAAIKGGKALPESQKAIAVVPLHGPITHRSGLFSAFFGGTSLEKWDRMYDELMANPNIGAVVADIDSPGGEVSGLEESSTKIFKYRGTKPTVAVANTWAASAAYRLGTAFDELVVTPSGEVGSIGTYTKHMDYSKMLEKDGVDTTIVSAGEFKAEFNPYEPLSESAKAELQASVDHYYDMFVKAVAKHRGVSAASVKNDFGKGRMVRAKDAVALGMADRVSTLEETIRRVGGMLNSRARAKADHAQRDEELRELEGRE